MISDVEIAPLIRESGQIEFIDDLDALSDAHTCSCSAGDDNPF
jgi:hypothetical protein